MKKHLFLPVLLCLLAPGRPQAQDANYWFAGYNPGGYFTPGAVIAFNGDSGVLFYNPALLAYERHNSASISGNLYQYESSTIKDGVGTGLDLKSSGTNIIPLVGAGMTAFHGKYPFVLGYAILRDPVSTYEATQRRDAVFNVLPDNVSPGPETYIGQYSTQNFITHVAGILSVGFKLGQHFSAGFSVEGRVRRQSFNESFTSRALYNVPGRTDTLFPPVASYQNYYLVSYTHVGMIYSAGVSYNAGGNHLGLLVCSPLVHLYGSATLYADFEVNDLPLGPNLMYNILADTRQTGLGARWKEPLRVSLGYARDIGSAGQLYVAAEYFAPIQHYNVITPNNTYFYRPDTGNNNAGTSDLLRFKDARKTITNVAIGCRFPVNTMVTGYAAFRTDFTYSDPALYDKSTGRVANTSDWNIYHLDVGVNVRRAKYNLRVGLIFSYGATSSYLQPYNFDDPNVGNLLRGTVHEVRASEFSIGLPISYVRNF